VFEPIATAFAEMFIAALVAHRTVGAAIRLARPGLLKKGWNPLGLLYVPFAMATLRLSQRVTGDDIEHKTALEQGTLCARKRQAHSMR
jgi:hypothetical protein